MTQEGSETVSEADFRAVCGRFATGVAVITARRPNGRLEGVTVNSFTSLSLRPPLVLFCLDYDAGTFPAFDNTRHFAVNILSAEQKSVSETFSAIGLEDRFANTALVEGVSNDFPPLIDGCLGHLICEVEARHPGGDHRIIVGRVLEVRFGVEGDPLLYFGGYRSIAP